MQAILDLAKTRSKRDYLIFSLLRWSFRVGEVVGHKGLPGIHPEDIRTETIWVRGKGYARGIVQDKELPADRAVIAMLIEFVKDTKPPVGTRVFPITVRWVEQLTKWYARTAGVADWEYVSPHRLRAFFATNARDKGITGPMIQQGMRHKKYASTELYIGPASTEQLVATVDQLTKT